MPNGHGGRRKGAGSSSNNQRHGPARRGPGSLHAFFPCQNTPRAEAEQEDDQPQHQQVEEESAQQEVEENANIEDGVSEDEEIHQQAEEEAIEIYGRSNRKWLSFKCFRYDDGEME